MAETTKMALVDWLDDLTVRFLLNLPASELSSMPRLCFQVEEAQWFYEDFIRPAAATAGDPLPSLSLRQFCLLLFQHCPLLSGFTDAQHIAAYEEFLAYKVRVPVRGAILMDEDMEKLVLVKGWKKGASWSFPRGKINKDERDLDCAIREVYEETGYDVRQAGLVPEDENDVKYIDITMREQHMRLFVFRGVPEDTYFEPKTRKEISKIQWYNVRDLPGFKKSKQSGDQAAQGNKFYMVAPFLGPLKKWINQQRRSDLAPDVAELTVPVVGEEDYSETQAERTPEPAVDNKLEELKRLLSIGTAPLSQRLPETRAATQPNDLLALLRGGQQVKADVPPQTSWGQFDAFTRQPPTPQPDHTRLFSYNTPAPQFPVYDPGLYPQQQQPHTFPAPPHNAIRTGHESFAGQGSGFAPRQDFGFTGVVGQGAPIRDPWQAQSNERLASSGIAPANVTYLPERQPVQPPQLPAQLNPQQSGPHPALQRPAVAQGSQGAIASAPAVPKAEQLPMPRLNPQSVNLLNAFKAGNKIAAPASSAGSQGPRQPSTHQTALLDLFRKAGGPQPSSENAADPNKSAVSAQSEAHSPVVVEVATKPKMQERRPTLNEITRTLPKSRSSIKSMSQEGSLSTSIVTPPPAPKGTHVGQAVDHGTAQAAQRPVSNGMSRSEVPPPTTSVTILQRPPSRHISQTPRTVSPLPIPKTAVDSPKRPAPAKGSENGAPTPRFTILSRPSSVRASHSPVPKAPSDLLQDDETVKPEDQQRPSGKPGVALASPRHGLNLDGAPGDVDQKRDQLLALFGKPPVSNPVPPPIAEMDEPGHRPNPVQTEERRQSLTRLSSPVQPPTTSAPPPAPQILPERRPSAQNRPQNKPHALLDLFNKPHASNAQLNSPGTPISPFVLGTPARRDAPAQIWPSAEDLQQRGGEWERVGSASPSANGAGARVGSSVTTPVEAKNFLLGYLNGVVMKEGQKGGRHA